MCVSDPGLKISTKNVLAKEMLEKGFSVDDILSIIKTLTREDVEMLRGSGAR